MARAASRIVAGNPVTEPPRSIAFPVPCAACHAPLGFPYLASTLKGVSGGIRIGIRCRACRAEWSLDIHSESGFLRQTDTSEGTDD